MQVDPNGSPCHYPATHWVGLTPATHWVDCQNLWYGSRAHHPTRFGIHYRHGAPNPMEEIDLEHAQEIDEREGQTKGYVSCSMVRGEW